MAEVDTSHRRKCAAFWLHSPSPSFFSSNYTCKSFDYVLNALISALMDRNIVICGGGVIGASIAYYLSRRGMACTIIERSSVAAAASGAL